MADIGNGKNGDNSSRPYKDGIFQLYVTWRALPAHLKGINRAVLQANLGIEDEDALDLLTIKNQTAFAQKYDISASTLSQWNKLIEQKDLMADSRNFYNKLVSNVIFVMYKNAISFNRNSHRDRENFIKLVFGKKAFENTGIVGQANSLMDMLKAEINERKVLA